MYYYPKLPCFIENVSLNVSINTLCPTACFMPTDFYPMYLHLFSTIICIQNVYTPLVSQVPAMISS